MKSKLFSLLVLFFLSSAVMVAQSSDKRKVGSFSELKIAGVFDVHLSQGNTEMVEIQAPDHVIDDIITENKGGRLTVKMREKKNYKNLKKVKVFISFKNLDYLENANVGSLKSDGTLSFNKLDLKITAVGNTDLDIEAKSIDADISAVGNTQLTGNVNKMSIRNKSVGNFRASDLKVDHLEIRSTAVGNTEVYAEKEISIHNSGIGGLRYKGNATIKELNSSGIGKVRKM